MISKNKYMLFVSLKQSATAASQPADIKTARFVCFNVCPNLYRGTINVLYCIHVLYCMQYKTSPIKINGKLQKILTFFTFLTYFSTFSFKELIFQKLNSEIRSTGSKLVEDISLTSLRGRRGYQKFCSFLDQSNIGQLWALCSVQ